MGDRTTFLLNGDVAAFDCRPTTTLLEWLRLDRRLCGTKEGCAEGDCGACTVVVAERAGHRVVHRAMNACILFMPMLEGKSVTTVEGVKGPKGELHPCQQALVQCHGSQCGFCTPGFVMSLYAAYLSGERCSVDDTLAGNLCRCTGYGPIVQAAERMWELPRPDWLAERLAHEKAWLRSLVPGGSELSPATLAELDRILASNPETRIVAGATDVGLWVTKQHRRIEPVVHVGRVAELRGIEEGNGVLRIGATVTYSEAYETITRLYPDFGELLRRLGSVQVRNAGTIGGNIANGSPIGDTPPALIALQATLVLRKAGVQRRLAIEDFFIDYGRQDRRPGEIVEAVEIPFLDDPERLRCYKVSKRFDQDISAVCGCFDIRVEGGLVKEARIAYGGMAAIPKRAKAVEGALSAKPWTRATVEAALPAYAEDFKPIDDMRASADYRLKVARNLLLRCFHESQAPLSETRLVRRGAEVA